MLSISKVEMYNLMVESLATLMSKNTSNNQKRAGIMILKIFIGEDGLKKLLSMDDSVSPFDREDFRVRKWKKEVLSRGICENCGSKKNLEAHHIIHWSDYPEGRIDLDNGQCLCHDCHTEEHRNDKSYWMMKAKKVS